MERSKCNCYHEDKICYTSYPPIIKTISRCYGTKDMEICTCGGNREKCNFYQKKDEEAEKIMNTAEMIAEARFHDDVTYCSMSKFSGGIWYNNKKGFHYNNGIIIKHVDYLDEIMNLDDWSEYIIPAMTKSEAEEKFNIKIIG